MARASQSPARVHQVWTAGALQTGKLQGAEGQSSLVSAEAAGWGSQAQVIPKETRCPFSGLRPV